MIMLALKIDYKLRLKHILPLANQKSHCLFLKNHLYPIPDQYALNKLKIPLLRFEVFPPKFYSFVFLNVDQYMFLHLIQFQIQYYKIPYKKMKSNSFRCMDNLKEVIVYSTRPIDRFLLIFINTILIIWQTTKNTTIIHFFYILCISRLLTGESIDVASLMPQKTNCIFLVRPQNRIT